MGSRFPALDPYAVLGVSTSAGYDEVRAAYLRLARENHPDFTAGAVGAAREASDRRMREVNQAWEVLGDQRRRSEYDTWRQEQVREGPVRIRHDQRGAFRPFHDIDEDDDDSWRYEPDIGDPATAPGRFLALGPVGLFSAGIVILCVSVVLGSSVVAITGLMAIGLSLFGFLVALFVTMARSVRSEHG